MKSYSKGSTLQGKIVKTAGSYSGIGRIEKDDPCGGVAAGEPHCFGAGWPPGEPMFRPLPTMHSKE
jgi:hypothetical protein